MLIANGHVYPEVDTYHPGSTYKEPCLFYWNSGEGKFRDLSKSAGPGCTTPEAGRGLAMGDLWNDGRESAVINNSGGQPSLLVNVASNPNHWIEIALQGTRSNRDGIGARVTVTAGGRRRVQEVRSGSSYISSSDLRLHFGLGKAGAVDSILVEWPSGLWEKFPSCATDRIIELKEGSGQPQPHT